MFYFVVVPIINDKTWRWGVRATRAMSYETRPPMIAKFRQKQHAEMFMRACNMAVIAPNIEARSRGATHVDAYDNAYTMTTP